MNPTAGVDAEQQEPVELSEAYVHSLASLGLARLQDEPGRLQAEAVAVEEALHSLSLDHYRVFIQNQECVRHVREQGKEMEGHLASLLAEVHGLGSEFSVFQREAAELVGGHKRNRQTLKHHMQLVELLEVPQLMDACVRSDLMEEALSIATFASTLERRHRSRRAGLVSSPSGSGAGAGGGPSSSGERQDGKERDHQAVEGHVPGVIKMIVEEVRESARALHERLVAKLRGPIQLTSCLQVVSCLRRLELLALEQKNESKQQRQRAKASPPKNGGAAAAAAAASGGGGVSQRQLALVEMKLQVDFLEARDAWLADAASRVGGHGGGGGSGGSGGAADLQHALGGPASSPYQVLMDLIESSRSQWFEVASQFRAIFLSVDVGGAGSKPAAAAAGGSRGTAAAMPGSGRGSGDVLSLWLLRRVSAFVEQLKRLLPLVEDGGLLRSLLEECMFFGASMGRLGTDFRGLLVPVFEERVIGAAAGQWATAAAEFVVTLRDIAAIEAAGANGSSLLYVPDKGADAASSLLGIRKGYGIGTGGDIVDAERAAAAAALTGDGGPPSPPRSLMAFPPVARLFNVVLTSFNQLRECLPFSVEDRLADALVLCFTEAFQGLADLQKTTLKANASASAAAASSHGNAGSPLASGGPSSRRGGGREGRGIGAGAGAGADHLITTSRALELACVALAEKAVPHLALCFAALFGESPPIAAGGAGSGDGSKRTGRAENLRGRLLDALKSFGIYEPPAAPAPAPGSATSPPSGIAAEAAGAAGAAAGASSPPVPEQPAAASTIIPSPFSPSGTAAEDDENEGVTSLEETLQVLPTAGEVPAAAEAAAAEAAATISNELN